MSRPSLPAHTIARPPIAIRLATGVGLVTLAALGAVAPATARVSAMAPRATVAVWAALACVALGPMTAVVLAFRLSESSIREALRGSAAIRLFAVALSLMGLFVGLTIIASVLRATTHNHVLAGVTFACSALVVALFVLLSGLRLMRLLEAAGRPMRWFAVAGLSVLAATAAAWIVYRVVHAPTTDPNSVGAAGALVDVPLFGLCAFVASRRAVAELPGLSLLALGGVPLAVAVISIGSPLLNEAWVRSTLSERAPAFASTIALAMTAQEALCARATGP